MKSPIKDINPAFANLLGPVKEIIPPHAKVNSFLFFSGALEFNLAEANRHVLAHTTQYVVYEFWVYAIQDPRRVKEMAKFIVQRAEGDELLFATFQKDWLNYRDPYMRAAMFFVLNRSSSTGQLAAGEYVPSALNPLSFAYLGNLQPVNFDIRWTGDEEIVKTLTADGLTGDYWLIPAGKFSYNFFEEGKNKGSDEATIPHAELCAHIKKLPHRVVVLYQFHPGVLQLYKDFNIHMYDKFGNPTTERETCEDLIVTNF